MLLFDKIPDNCYHTADLQKSESSGDCYIFSQFLGINRMAEWERYLKVETLLLDRSENCRPLC